MSNFFEQVKRFIDSIKKLFKGSKSSTVVEVPVAAPTVKPTKPVPPSQVTPVTEANVTSEGDQIAISDPAAEITSFLLKPVSDTNPKITVITVSSDLARAEDVKIQIKDKNGKVIKINEVYNIGGVKRANKLAGNRFGRFNFKTGPTAEQFKKLAPIEVSFYLELNGKRKLMPVMGKKSIVVKDPTKRFDLK